MNDPADPDMVYSLCVTVNAQAGETWFAGTTASVDRSTDAGQTWREICALGAPSIVASPAFAADNTIIAGVVGGVLLTHDGGETWRAVALPGASPLVARAAFSPDYARDGVIFAATTQDGMFCSMDRGERWSPWNFGLLDLSVLALAVSPDYARDETVYIGTGTGLFRSTNGGRAWREITLPTQGDDLPAVSAVALAQGDLYVGLEDGGLWASRDLGQTWLHLVPEMITGEVTDILVDSANDRVLVVANGLLFSTPDRGQTWSAPLPDQTSITALALLPDGRLLGAVRGGPVLAFALQPG